MILLLTKASVVIIVLLAFYKLVLERESFFKANRIYLIACLVLACILPFVVLPQIAENQGFVSELIAPTDKGENDLTSVKYSDSIDQGEQGDITDNKEQAIENQKPANLPSNELTNETATFSEASNPTTPINKETVEVKSQKKGRSLSFWLIAIYAFGAVVLLIKLIGEIIATLWKASRHSDKIEDDGAVIVNMNSPIAPCSFFRYIFINPASYDYDTYEQILNHEKIHVNKGHTVDLLLSELAVVLLWFNPFVWMLRKEVEKNIEYQTDGILVDASSEVKESYQLNLVRIACDTQPLAITTNYNQSLIKQRILKMNNKKSNHHSYWKYAFIAPLIFALVVMLNKPNVSYAQGAQPENLPGEVTQKSPNIDQPQVKEETDAPEKRAEENSKPEGSLKADCGDLTEAVRNEDIDLVKELLKAQKPNCVDPDPGYIETVSGKYTWRRSNARTPLAAAGRNGNLEIARLLVEAGADVNFDAGDHGSPMTEAAGGGYTELVSYLLEEGADINETSDGQGSPLNAASRNGHTTTVAFLLEKGADINYQNDGQGSALNAAARNGYVETMKLLLKEGANIDATNDGQGSALNAAARNGHLEAVTLLLAEGADIHSQNDGQGTALNAAARNGHDDMVKLLLDRGAGIDRQNDGQGSALNAAARNGHDSTVKLLLERGADVNRRNDGQGSAMNAAARNGHISTVELLLEAGADIDAQTDGQGSVLNAAARNGNLRMVEFLLDKGADVNLQNDGQGSALNAAARNGHRRTVELLLERGADIDRQNDGQGSALNAAARNGHYKTVELLLDKGADINRQNDGQGSALNAAARNGHLAMVELLVERGARVNQYSDGQGTALSAASRNRHRKVVQYLISKGADR
ncbi:MAG: hypothetical protein HEP71_12960 [Roseivirga sp.]|nr:hypothetical protein [Roseivirga sp.]